ncbi:MAG: hypothetical protein PHI70_04085 [Proteiniphilum sp.]|nr:hypothetical protein [Proteiniphilum sp.]MDD3908620.1 hypothetical protein [Proteiniphilum sp.]MDD4415947.1 hypothetical protein [Proteiniphilum sp.]
MMIMLLVGMLCMLFSPLAVYASEDDAQSPKASEYIRSTSVNITPQGNGRLLVENKLGATRTVDQLGIISLEIQKKVGGYWQSIDTLVTDDYAYNTGTYIYDCYYYGTPGTEYRSYVEFYVEDDGGSEIKIVTSTPKTAY